MKKKVFLILIILIAFISIGIFYLNKVILPVKIKSLIINGLGEQTQKKVNLESLQFNIFKGLVLRNLIIYDDKRPIISLKEASCTILILPIFKKTVIIPNLRLKDPKVFLKRRQDNSFNIRDLFSHKTTQSPEKAKFALVVYKINLTDADIYFQDDTFSPPFSKNIENLNLNLHLSLPSSVRFSLKSEIPINPVIKINASGDFRIPEKQLIARISVQDFSPGEFSDYYKNLGVSLSEGLINALISLRFKDNTLYANLEAKNKNLNISKEKISAKINSDLRADFQYNLADKQLEFSGKATIADSSLCGLEIVDVVNDINGEVEFNNSGLTSDKLRAHLFGMPIQAQVKLTDFNNPLFNLDISSSLNLASLQGILKDKFKLAFPGDIKGEANLFLNAETKIPSSGILEINGSLDILNAMVKLEKIDAPVEDISGRLEFNQSQLKWSDLNLKYLGVPYKTTGILTNFQSPGVQLDLASKDLSLQSIFAVNHRLIKLSKFSGQYLNSEFSLTGEINTVDPANLETEINGRLNINLEDIKEALKKYKDRLEQIKPQGLLNAQFNLNGNINEIKSCAINADFSGSAISAYSLNAKEFLLNYRQANSIIDIPLIHLSLYDGTIDAKANINLNSANLPYWIAADMQGIKIEKMKLDTAAREKDISGTIQTQVKLNGFSNDLSKLSGAGKIFIAEGKLWQLNLFKGLGALLFAKDFANIIFHEGYCGFFIQDKYIFTDNLKLKSNITDLSGSVKIGFDGSLDASLNVQVLDKLVPLSGTFKDITTAIIGQSGRFGVIKVSGTLNEPKYKFQPAVIDIIKGLKESIFGK